MELADVLRGTLEDVDETRLDDGAGFFDLFLCHLQGGQLCLVKARGVVEQRLVAVRSDGLDDIGNDVLHG